MNTNGIVEGEQDAKKKLRARTGRDLAIRLDISAISLT